MKKVFVFLAEGFEEIEAVTPLDFLRRAGADVTLVAVSSKGKEVCGAHNIVLQADVLMEDFSLPDDAQMLVFPGGAGVERLRKSDAVKSVLEQAARDEIYIAAICAAPLLLHDNGLISGKKVTAFPSVQQELHTAQVTGAAVEVDGSIITARSAGVALQFAHSLAEILLGKKAADDTLNNLYPEK